MISRENKIGVFNPLLLKEKVGEKVCEIFEENKLDVNSLNISNLKNKEKLSCNQINNIAKTFNKGDFIIEFLETYQKNYIEFKELNNKQMKELNDIFKKFKNKLNLQFIRDDEKTEIDVLGDVAKFFGVEDEKDLYNTCANKAFYKKSNNKINEINLATLLRRGELDFENIKNKNSYNKEAFEKWINSKEWEKYIRSESDVDFKKIPSILQQYGVYLFLYPYIKNTVYGCIEWVNKTPIILITDREHDLAMCWRTLFHEFGHAILHEYKDFFDDTQELSRKVNIKEIEKEANSFSNSYLCGGDALQKNCFVLKKEDYKLVKKELKEKFNAYNLFIEYWMRQANIMPRAFKKNIYFDLN
jgi:Zn-dependent peptidase ImmA (M78 family)